VKPCSSRATGPACSQEPEATGRHLHSFSAYEDYGIELVLRITTTHFPERAVHQEVFIHSLDSAGEFSQKLFCVLFYLKNRGKLEAIDHPMMKDLKAVLQGERIKGYPPWKISRTGQISMISNSDKISRKEEINELFEQLGNVFGTEGRGPAHRGCRDDGAGAQDATKDIDVVCRSEEDKDRLLAASRPSALNRRPGEEACAARS